MRSPWKYLVGLASRGRTPQEAPERPLEGEASEPSLTANEETGAPVDPQSKEADPVLQTADELEASTEHPIGAVEETH